MNSGSDPTIDNNIRSIRSTIAVISGKGGVGKTTVTALLAVLLMRKGYRVGILDVDIHGPDISRIFGIEDQSFQVKDDRIIPLLVEDRIRIASAAALGYGEDTAFVWRGPMKLGIIKQFLSEVDWGATEVLLIDTPPGTGDELMTVAQYLPSLTGSIVVSTPQPVSLLDARRSVFFARETNMPIIGILENMADSEEMSLFGRGGTEEMAQGLKEKFLGSLPLSQKVPQWCEGNILQMSEDIFPESMIYSLMGIINR